MPPNPVARAGGHGGPGGRPRGMQGEKPKNFGATMARLFAYNKRFIPAIVGSALLSGVGAILGTVGPKLIAQVTDIISAGLSTSIDVPAATNVAFLLVGLYVLSALFELVQGFVTTWIGQRSSQQMRRALARKIDRLPLGYFHDTSVGDVLSRVTNDVGTASQALTQSLGSIVSSTASLIGTLFMMLTTNVVLTLAGISASIVGVVIMLIVVSRSQKLFSAQQAGLGAVNGHVEEIISGQQVVRLYNAQEQALSTFNTLNHDLYDSAWKSQFASSITMPFMGFAGNLSYVVVSILGAAMALDGQISFGVIVAFMLYVRQFSQPLSRFSMMLSSLQSSAAAAERFFAFLDAEEMQEESGKQDFRGTAPDGQAIGDVEFDHVRFGYTPDKTIIHDLSFHAYPGQKIAIVGPTGAGKTTLVNLLMRFYELDSGEIRIDGQNIANCTRASIREQFAMVLQESWIFEGSVRDNIAFGIEGLTDEAILAACEKVGLSGYISTLSNGLDTQLSEDGDISQGQRQMITIARAMLQDAPMLILDEATSSVDTRTELLIQRAMDTLMENRTSFVIAHRLSTIRNAGYILVMRDGDVIERGNHEELMALGGFYAELYMSQFDPIGD